MLSVESLFANRPDLQSDWRLAEKILTPYDQAGVGGCYYKREDAYAPLGFGGVNGSKVRQATWYFDYLLRLYPDADGFVFGGSIRSPLHVRVAAIARHFGKKSLNLFGATNANVAWKHDIVQQVEFLGAELDFGSKVAYNNALSKRAAQLAQERNYLRVPYGLWLGPEHLSEPLLRHFHGLAGWQVSNWPEHIKRVILPAGTCTTAVSVFNGILVEAERTRGLREVVLPVIGTDHTQWFWERAAYLQRMSLPDLHALLGQRSLEVKFYHDKRMCDWSDEAKGVQIGDLYMHPAYEAKIVRWIRQEKLDWLDDPQTCFWLVGGHAQLQPMIEWETKHGHRSRALV